VDLISGINVYESYSNGKCSRCRDCDKKYQKQRYKNDPRNRMVIQARARAKRSKVPFDITPDDIFIPERCPVLDIPLSCNNTIMKNNSPSLDRIIPEKGYVKNNIAVISMKANRIKADATFKEIEAVAAWLKVTIQEGGVPFVNP
jgi:hypothetical protein